MEPRVVVAAALVAVAVAVAWVIERRRTDPPTAARTPVPTQLDRADFTRPDAPWLVALFSSRTCDSCATVARALPALEGDAVAIQEIEWSTDRALHERYRVDSVPLTLVVDGEGVVWRTFLGAVTATDLWAAVADAREGRPSPCEP